MAEMHLVKVEMVPPRFGGERGWAGTIFFLRVFLEHFEQLEHAGERSPLVGALSANSPLESSVRHAFDIEEKANRLPRRW
jgi:hypothetical protein